MVEHWDQSNGTEQADRAGNRDADHIAASNAFYHYRQLYIFHESILADWDGKWTVLSPRGSVTSSCNWHIWPTNLHHFSIYCRVDQCNCYGQNIHIFCTDAWQSYWTTIIWYVSVTIEHSWKKWCTFLCSLRIARIQPHEKCSVTQLFWLAALAGNANI